MRHLRKIILYLILTAITAVILLPLVWMVSTSLKQPGGIFLYPPKLWPDKIIWENYRRVWHAIPIVRGFINSLFISVSITVGQLITCSMSAYAFSRIKFPFRNKLFFLYLATLMVPTHVTMIPIFMLIKTIPEFLNNLFHTTVWTSDMYIGSTYIGKPLGLDSYFALIIPFCFSAYGTFLLRQFFISIPQDYEDAGRMDGCGHLRIYFNIILPLSKPALATLATFTFMNAWKNYLWPLIIANNQNLMPLSVLIQWLQGLYSTDWTLLMAGSVIVMFPVILVFIFNQKYFARGLQTAAMTF